MPSQDVPRELRKTDEERRQDVVNLMEAVGKLWIAADEFWKRLKIVWNNIVKSARVIDGGEGRNGTVD
ncbi:hypothetical protein K435DRAFT_874041 [Dendrothele bispora CBS 962.96]|uniref:Uncharacterized protein n=1 Tax=Dendrothele bispora (strain CBS 962.96) TaxID=1314807 RepID=A0A4S8KXM5_DENBC|nr:hypothetical protein K435DRAFT_874041 [Dendrothele bispora CBS 962.96]